MRNLALLVLSLVFYGWGEPVYILIMFASILIDYTHGLLVNKYRDNRKKSRYFVIQSVVFNLLLLGFFKYWDFLAANLSLIPGISLPQLGLSLPIGISFFTFQTMSYTIDVYRNDAPAQKSIISFGAFVTMFPQLIAGPIVRYKTVAAELISRRHSLEGFSRGVRRFTVGLCKKVLLANFIGALWETELASHSAGTLTALGGWIGLAAFAFQIYFDFSGYSDMAIGLGEIFGFKFPENFNYPYTARSVTEFWRRWHISLTSWFREYLYIPLGGNRGGGMKTLRNILIVWFCTGLWHGASWNYLLWGMYFTLWLILERWPLKGLLDKTPALIKHIYTLFVVAVGWGLFAIEDLSSCFSYLGVCFGARGLISPADIYYLSGYGIMLAVMAVASTSAVKRLFSSLPQRARSILEPCLMISGLVLSTAFLVEGSYNPFLYFRF